MTPLPAVVYASILVAVLSACAIRAMRLSWRFSLMWGAMIGAAIFLSEISNFA